MSAPPVPVLSVDDAGTPRERVSDGSTGSARRSARKSSVRLSARGIAKSVASAPRNLAKGAAEGLEILGEYVLEVVDGPAGPPLPKLSQEEKAILQAYQDEKKKQQLKKGMPPQALAQDEVESPVRQVL